MKVFKGVEKGMKKERTPKIKSRMKSRITAWLLAVVLVCNGVDLTGLSVRAQEAESTEEIETAETVTAEISDVDSTEETEAEVYSVPDTLDVPDNDELFAEYAQSVFYPENENSTYANWGDTKLDGLSATIYNLLKERVGEVANGDASSTEFTLTWQELGVTKTSWTQAELGVTIVNSSTGKISAEAMTAAQKEIGYDSTQMNTVFNCLLADCPYDLYWFDKTYGWSGPSWYFSYNGSKLSLSGDGLTFRLYVVSAYAKDGASYETDTELTGAAKAAAVNAQAIVDANADLSDYEKLVAYKDKICELVSYNYDAASSSYSGGYGDPWQLIYVFDGDTNTNVVCEGYSKAFQYLCDLSEFSGDVTCYLPTGKMDGGGHMWNIVTIGGKNYMVDVTNSDGTSTGSHGGLFLSGAAAGGSVADGYTYNISYYNTSISYTYDSDTLSLYDESVLTMSDTDYDPTAKVEPLAQFTSRPYDLEGSNNGKTEGADDFWYNDTVTITPNDAAGDFKYIRIRVGSSVWSEWGTSAALDSEGAAVTFQIQMTTAVKDGKATGSIISETNTETSNLSQWKDSHTLKIDKSQPDFNASGYGISVENTSTWWKNLRTGIYFGQYLTPSVTMLAADALSGIAGYYYYVDSTDSWEGYFAKTESELDELYKNGQFTLSSNGKLSLPEADGSYVVYAYALDCAGNRSGYVCTDGIIKDDTSPVIEEGSLAAPSKEEETLGDIWADVKFKISEAGKYFYLVHDNTEDTDGTFTAPTSIRDLAQSEQGEWTNLVWSAKEGVTENEIASGDNTLHLSELKPNHSYTFYLAIVDTAGNSMAGVQTITFTTSLTLPVVTELPKLSGTYGTAVKDMTLTPGRAEVEGTVLDGTWEVTDEKKDEMPHNSSAKTYKVTFYPADSYQGIYDSVTVVVDPEVTPRPITVKADDVSSIYGKVLPQFTFSIIEGELAGADDKSALAIALPMSKFKSASVGTYEITGESYSVDYDVTIVPGQLTITQAESSIVTEQTSYVKTYGDSSFSLGCKAVSGEGEDAVELKEGKLTYRLSDGKDADGNAKDCSKILEISADGTVNILGSGSVVVTVSRPESTNYKAAEDKKITVTINKFTSEGATNGFYVEEVPEFVYTGAAIKWEPKVYDMDLEIPLEKNVDYTLSYKNNTKAYTLQPGEEGFDETKAPVIIIKGKGNYKAEVKIFFTIQPKNINDDDMTADDITLEYNGKQQLKVPALAYGRKKLAGVKLTDNVSAATAKKDFVYSYPGLSTESAAAAYKETGTYTIHVEGTNNYTGSRDIKVTVTGKGMLLSKAAVKKIANQSYQDGESVELNSNTLVVTAKVNGKKVTLEQGRHYTVEYLNNTEIGTATVILTGTNVDNGDGMRFSGTKKVTFKITGASLTKAKVSGLENKVYNGQEQEQNLKVTLTVKTGTGKNAKSEECTLIKGTDYEVSYSNNLNVGTATVFIKGKGGYTGTIKKTFKIAACDLKSNQNLIQLSIGGQTISGEKLESTEVTSPYLKGGSKPEVADLSISLAADCDLVEGRDFTVTYANNKAVTGSDTKKQPTITIKGKGNYTGTLTKSYVITRKSLQDLSITMTAADKAVKNTTKAGAYRVKPVLTDADGKVLKEGLDYTITGYATIDDFGETLEELSAASVVNTSGTRIRVTVSGKDNGAYTDSRSVIYCITKKGMSGLKLAAVTKTYLGKDIGVELTEEDFKAGVDEEDNVISKLTMKDGKDTYNLVYGRDFEIVEGSYKNNKKKGTASVTIRGLGTYGGNATIKFKIVEKTLEID